MTTHAVTLGNGYVVSDDRARHDMAFVHASLADAYWAIGRAPALTERSWAHSLCFGVYAPTGSQVGFARLLTDYTFRGHLGDVFISPTVRGMGLGKGLIATILAHPALVDVAIWTLQTSDARGLYAQFGFGLMEADGRAMRLDRARGGSPAALPELPPAPSVRLGKAGHTRGE